MARRKSRPSVPQGEDPEAIALRIHQIAATAGVLAVAAARLDGHGEPLSHALYLIEETLLDVEQRVELLRRCPNSRQSGRPGLATLGGNAGRNSMRIAAIIVFALLSVGCATRPRFDPCAPNSIGFVTQCHFSQIENGMTYDRIVGIIGWNGREVSNMMIRGAPFQQVQWINPGGIGGGILTVGFHGGVVNMKQGAGLP